MQKTIILFSGMPASGKDTITSELMYRDPRFLLCKRFRGIGPTDKHKSTYFDVSYDEFLDKVKAGDFLQYHSRYGRDYGVDKAVVLEMLHDGIIPIIHVGRIENYYTFCKNAEEYFEQENLSVNIIHILLWNTRDELIERITYRDKTPDEIKKRVRAMTQEFLEAFHMFDKGINPYDLIIKNEDIDDTCDEIINFLMEPAYAVSNQDRILLGYRQFSDYLYSLTSKELEL